MPITSSTLSIKLLSLITTTLVASISIYAAQATENGYIQQQHQRIHIRTLAASCAACHGTQGNSHSITPVLAGLNPVYFSAQMFAFKNKSRNSSVMYHHAQGLNNAEIEQLAQYFSEQKCVSTPSPIPQNLKAQYDQAQ